MYIVNSGKYQPKLILKFFFIFSTSVVNLVENSEDPAQYIISLCNACSDIGRSYKIV